MVRYVFYENVLKRCQNVTQGKDKVTCDTREKLLVTYYNTALN